MIDRKHHIVRGSSFEKQFFGLMGSLQANKQAKDNLENTIYTKKYPIKATGVSYRNINHWMSKGLLDDQRENEKGWRKFNFQELIWIKTIERLRTFDLSIEKIREVKKHIIDNQGSKALFDFFYVQALFQKKEIKLVVFENGEADLISKGELGETMILFPDLEYLSISFTGVLEEITRKKIERSDLLEIPVGKREKSLIENMQSGEYNQIDLQVKDKKIKKFKSKNIERETITNVKQVNIKELTKRKNAKIIIHTNDDENITSIEIESSV